MLDFVCFFCLVFLVFWGRGGGVLGWGGYCCFFVCLLLFLVVVSGLCLDFCKFLFVYLLCRFIFMLPQSTIGFISTVTF